MHLSGRPTEPESSCRDGCVPRNRFSRMMRRRPHEWHRRCQRRHRRRRRNVGSAIARALASTNLSVTLLEARRRRRRHQQGQYRAVAHRIRRDPRYARVATGGARLRVLGHYAEQTGIPVEHTGALLVAWTDEEFDALPGLKDKAERNFYHRCEIVGADRSLPPSSGPGPRSIGRVDGAR